MPSGEKIHQGVTVLRVIVMDFVGRRHNIEGRWQRGWDRQRFPVDSSDHRCTPRLDTGRTPNDRFFLLCSNAQRERDIIVRKKVETKKRTFECPWSTCSICIGFLRPHTVEAHSNILDDTVFPFGRLTLRFEVRRTDESLVSTRDIPVCLAVIPRSFRDQSIDNPFRCPGKNEMSTVGRIQPQLILRRAFRLTEMMKMPGQFIRTHRECVRPSPSARGHRNTNTGRCEWIRQGFWTCGNYSRGCTHGKKVGLSTASESRKTVGVVERDLARFIECILVNCIPGDARGDRVGGGKNQIVFDIIVEMRKLVTNAVGKSITIVRDHHAISLDHWIVVFGVFRF